MVSCLRTIKNVKKIYGKGPLSAAKKKKKKCTGETGQKVFPQFSPKEKDAGIFRYVKALQQKLIFEVEINQDMVLPIGLVIMTATGVVLFIF